MVGLRAGQRAAVKLPDGASVDAMRPIWGTEDGRAFVDQGGSLTSTHAGAGIVTARFGSRHIRTSYVIEPGPPSSLKASLLPAPNNPPDRHLLSLCVTDSYGNRIPGQTVQIAVTGGVAERTPVTTDRDGRATIEIVWDSDVTRRVRITFGELPAIILIPKASPP